MSTKGLYPAVSGAIAQDLRLGTIANNLANVNTAGFKRDGQIFREYLTAAEKTPDVLQVPKVPASIESFYNMQGADKSHVDAAGSYTDFSQGGLKATGNSMDIAVEGKGFVEVSTPQGIRLTRNPSMKVGLDNRIVDNNGNPILGQGTPGQGAEGRFLTVTSNAPLIVTEHGEIFQNGARIGLLSAVSVKPEDSLRKTGHNYYTAKENMVPQLDVTQELKFHQGFVESSNVNLVREMTDMIATTRTFESLQKAIQAYDSMNHKLVNDVPKF